MSSSKLEATTTQLGYRYAGALKVAVGPPFGTKTQDFTAYIPSVGMLAFGTVGTAEDFHECTGSVVASSTGDIVLMAGHCLKEMNPTTHVIEEFEEYAFAPGWTGPTCTGSKTHPIIYAREVFTCKAHQDQAPFGVWEDQEPAASSGWEAYEHHAYDFAFLIMTRKSGITIEHEVGGGLPIAWDNSGTNPSGPPYYQWDAVGHTLNHCIETGFPFQTDGSPPNNFDLECAMAPGNSGGPWLRNDASPGKPEIGAVNSTASLCGKTGWPPCYSDKKPGAQTNGAYMGDEAHEVLEFAVANDRMAG